MSWSTELFCRISFNRETYESKQQVQEDIDDLNDIINYSISRIKNLSTITEPNKFYDFENYADPLDWLNDKITEAIETLEESYIEKYKLELLLDNWDKCHNDKNEALSKPDNIKWDTAFIWGDFIKKEKECTK